MRNKKEFIEASIESPPPPAQWMISFADLLSLILTFFVLLYSISALDKAKWEKIAESISKEMTTQPKVSTTNNPTTLSIRKIKVPEAVNLDYLSSILKDKLRDAKKLKGKFRTTLEPDRLVISLPQNAFSSANAKLDESLKEQLDIISNVLYAVGNHVDVYAYASAEEIKEKTIFPSQWELALARAESISQALRNMGYPYKITSFARSGERTADAAQAGKQADTVKTGENLEHSPRKVDIVIRPYPAEW